MAKRKERTSPIFANLEPEEERKLTPAEEDSEEALERLERIEYADLHQKDRELQKAFQDITEASSKGKQKYDSRVKLRAALAYVVTASSVEASKLTGVPHRTIRSWKQTAPWWPVAVKYALESQKENLDAKLGQIVDKALDAALSRVEGGDPVLIKDVMKDKLTGETATKTRIEYVPIKGKDLMVMASIGRDKQAILRGEPTSISEKKTDKELINDVAAKLAETIAQHNAPKGIIGTYDKEGNKIDD